MEKTVEQLRELCRRYRVRIGRRKEELVRNLTTRFEVLSSDYGKINKLRKELTEKNLPKPAHIHKYYRSWFLLVDLHDRMWYKTLSRHFTHL
jgi:hypothetical protein